MKSFFIFRKKNIWYCRIKLTYDNNKQLIHEISSKDYKKIIKYAWMVNVENDISLLEALILI